MEKKKRDFKPLIIIILIVVLSTLIYFNFKGGTNSNSEITTSQKGDGAKEEETSNETETTTISSSGEIETGLDEKLELHATYYYEEIYYEEGDYVSEGENILKYTNGTYLQAPYNLVIKSISVPSSGSQCTDEHYIEAYSVDSLSVSISVSEDNINKISVGQEVTIVAKDGENTYIGYVTKISNSGTYSSRGTTYAVEISFENDGNLKIGMSATITMKIEN